VRLRAELRRRCESVEIRAIRFACNSVRELHFVG
jgi:hypothetical protein